MAKVSTAFGWLPVVVYWSPVGNEHFNFIVPDDVSHTVEDHLYRWAEQFATPGQDAFLKIARMHPPTARRLDPVDQAASVPQPAPPNAPRETFQLVNLAEWQLSRNVMGKEVRTFVRALRDSIKTVARQANGNACMSLASVLPPANPTHGAMGNMRMSLVSVPLPVNPTHGAMGNARMLLASVPLPVNPTHGATGNAHMSIVSVLLPANSLHDAVARTSAPTASMPLLAHSLRQSL
ncbi:hypothetical protein GGF32_008842 [Allomyces javanicus]|nr:hypothetical protein GGF32_008842 [Allomyces javanicus]